MGVKQFLALAAGAGLLAGLSLPAQAGLGGDARSVDTDRVQLKAQVTVTAGAAFTVHALTLPTGTVVHEYLSPQGKVFAVAWVGQSIPDLRQTLGTYYANFRAAVDNAPPSPNHHQRSVVQADIVVHTSARMRQHAGLVYVPALMPPGVSPSDLR